MKRTVNVTFAALFTAVICLLSQISFVTPGVPVTLQVLGIALCGYTLSTKWAVSCVVTYICVGALGLPVFSSFKGGIQALLGPTGGFILGFVLLSLCCGLSSKANTPFGKIIISAIGLLLCHILGVLQYSIVTGCGIIAAVLTASFPFILKDIILIIAAFYLSKFIKKRIINLKL